MDTKTTITSEKSSPSWKIWNRRRHILTFLVFLGFFTMYALRVNMSIAVVAMTQERYRALENGSEINIGPEFKWDNRIQGYVLSAFFYGYISTQLLGSLLCRKFGGKLVFGGSIASTSFFALISPWLAEWNVYALLVARIVMGVFEGAAHSTAYYFWSRWIPPKERTRVTCQTNSGSYIGSVFSMMFFAYLAKVAGWRSIFWFAGGLGLFWFILWWKIVTDSPDKDPKISKAELQYIESSLKDCKTTRKNPVPWKQVFTNKAVWALNAGLFCEIWGYYTLMTLLPKYFKDVYEFDIAQSGLLSALPYICLTIMMNVIGQVADRIIHWNWMSATVTRKIFVVLGYSAQTCCMLGAAYWSNITGTVFCLVIAVGFSSLALSTLSVNALDIAPQYSTVVFGIAGTWGSLPGIISPTIAGYIISTENKLFSKYIWLAVEQWQIIFFIAAGFYLAGSIIFVLLASGERQSWDFEQDSKEQNRKKSAEGKPIVDPKKINVKSA